jgi:hypothetical protein
MTIHDRLTASFISRQYLVLDRKAVNILPTRFKTIITVHNLGQSQLTPQFSIVGALQVNLLTFARNFFLFTSFDIDTK